MARSERKRWIRKISSGSITNTIIGYCSKFRIIVSSEAGDDWLSSTSLSPDDIRLASVQSEDLYINFR